MANKKKPPRSGSEDHRSKSKSKGMYAMKPDFLSFLHPVHESEKNRILQPDEIKENVLCGLSLVFW